MTTKPKLCSREPRSRRGVIRQYNATLRAYRRAFNGGALFGFDWPTFAMNDPAAYAHVRVLKSLFLELPR